MPIGHTSEVMAAMKPNRDRPGCRLFATSLLHPEGCAEGGQKAQQWRQMA